MLFQVVLRSLCEGSEERLFLEEPVDHFVSEIQLTDTSSAFTQKYLSAFREDLPEDQTQAVLQDRLDTGWLVWGKTMEVARLPGWEEKDWSPDDRCKEGVKVFEDIFTGEGWWQKVNSIA
jgi:proteasome activator subunit 4